MHWFAIIIISTFLQLIYYYYVKHCLFLDNVDLLSDAQCMYSLIYLVGSNDCIVLKLMFINFSLKGDVHATLCPIWAYKSHMVSET